MTFDEWLTQGIAAGYCSQPVCLMHDFPSYLNEEDQRRFDEGHDPCIGGVTLKNETPARERVPDGGEH